MKLILLILSAIALCAQSVDLYPRKISAFTVATLPTVAAGYVAVVTDASTAGSCTVGGGSALALCRYSGSAWVSLGGAGSSYTFVEGDGMSVSTVGSTITFATDATTVPEYFVGAGDPNGVQACTQGRSLYFRTANNTLYQCTSTGTTWAAVGSSLISRSAITGDVCSNGGATTTLYDFAANQLAVGDTVEVSIVGRVAGTVGTPLMRIQIEGVQVSPNVAFGGDAWALGTSRTYVVTTTTANSLGMAQRANGSAPTFESDVAHAINTASSTGFTVQAYNESCTGGGTMTLEYTIKQVRNAP